MQIATQGCTVHQESGFGGVRRHNPEYRAYYQKKYQEVTRHQHKRALVLTARKLVRLVHALLRSNKLYRLASVLQDA